MRVPMTVLSAALFMSGCVKSDISRTGTTYPPRPEGCEVELIPEDPPEYEFEKVGEAEVQCHVESQGRDVCIDKLKVAACELGAHAVYEFHEGEGDGYISISASFAHKTEAESESGAEVASEPGTESESESEGGAESQSATEAPTDEAAAPDTTPAAEAAEAPAE